MLWIGAGVGRGGVRMVREIVVIWQPVQLEREITTGARAWMVEHLSTSHRNDSHNPVGSHYFATLDSHSNLLVARMMMIAVGFMSAGADIYSNCLGTLVLESLISFLRNSQSCASSRDWTPPSRHRATQPS